MSDIIDYAEQHGLKPADESALGDIIAAVVAERLDFVKERGMGAIGPLWAWLCSKPVQPMAKQ